MPPRLTIIGINYAPEPSGNAPYTTALAEGMAELGWKVKVVTGFPHYPQWEVHAGYEGRTRVEQHGGVEVLRLRHYVPSDPKLLNRTLMEIHFGLRSILADWNAPDVVLFVSPGLISSALASLRAKLSYARPGTVIWVQDLYSRGLEELHASHALATTIARKAEGAVLRIADHTVVIHERFYQHAIQHLGLQEQRVRIHRNWTHIRPRISVDVTAVRRRREWSDHDIIVLHAGNMGLKQHLQNVVEAARLADATGSRVRFVLLGAGSQRQSLLALGQGIERLEFLDPLPNEEYTAVLAAADILLVNESPELREMCVPSKLTSYFTTGRPILAAVNNESSTAGEVEASGAGRLTVPGNPHELLEAAEALGADRSTASALGAHGPSYATEHLSTHTAMLRWNELLLSLAQQHRRRSTGSMTKKRK